MPAIARIDAAQGQDRRRALAAGHHLVRHEVHECAHHHVGHAMRYLVVRVDDRRRKLRVHDRALGSPDFDTAPAARIGRDEIVRVDRGLEPAKDARGGHRERCVHRTFDLRVSAGKVHHQTVCGLLHRQTDAELRIRAGGVVGNAVAIAEILENAFAVRQIHQRRAHQPFGIIHNLRHVANEFDTAVALGERLQTIGCAQRCGELGAEIAFTLVGRANIRQDELFEVDIERAAADQPQRRDAQPFAEDLRDRAVAAGRRRADIRPMRAQASVAEQLAVIECGPHHIHVRQVAAPEIGVVVDENVAVVHVGSEHGDDGAHRIGHRAEVNRQIGALRHHLAACVEDAAGIIASRLQDRRIGRLGEDDPHLLGDLVEAVLDDLEGGGIGPLHQVFHCCLTLFCSCVSSTKPSSFIFACHPGGTRMVESSNSITAGPATFRPGGMRLRS